MCFFRDKKLVSGIIILISGMILLFAVLYAVRMANYDETNIVLNEICSNNKSIAVNADGMIADYIELHNKGNKDCKINDLYLSDDLYDLKKISLAGQIISADGYLLIPCVEDNDSFAISNRGETLYLSNENGRILQQIKVPELDDDEVYFINYVSEKLTWEIGQATPAMDNATGVEMMVEAPALSHESGFYDEEFDLQMTSTSGTMIYYSLDGSVPNENANLYQTPIHVYNKSSEENVWNNIPNVKKNWEEEKTDPVPKAFIVRAVAVDELGNRSDIVTSTYFVGLDEWKDKNVISLVSTPYDLFSNDIGIYVTGTEYDEWYLNGQEGEEPKTNFEHGGRDWERPAIVEIFEESQSILQQNVGIRIQGASTRNRSKKRFSIYARKDYSGSNYFDVPLFDSEIRSHSVFLRTEVEDAMPQSLMDDRDIAIQRYKPVTLFLNGEYWYDTFLREKYDSRYFEEHYGIDRDNLVIFQEGTLEEGVETDNLLYKELYDFVENNDLSEDEVYERFCEIIDIENHINYLCANIYCANRDVNDTHNVLMYRSREKTDDHYSDGKWRWAMYDMDALRDLLKRYYGVDDCASINSFSQETLPEYKGNVPYNQHVIYAALRQNDQFCKQFVLTFMDLVNSNFSVENVSRELAAFGEDITWFESFFEKRPFYMKQYLAEEFELTGSLQDVIIWNTDEAKGTVRINSIEPKMSNGNWKGEYYTDYPVTVTALPAEGYEFVCWTGSIDSKDISIEIPITETGVILKAEFKKID